MPGSTERIAGLRDFLSDELGWEFDLNRLDHRIRMQKYVFLAKELGLDVEFDYNMYLHGPYSPALAETYYEGLADVRASEEALDGLDTRRFLRAVEDRSTWWLELASTLVSLSNRYSRYGAPDEVERKAIARASELKDTDAPTLRPIWDELRRHELV